MVVSVECQEDETGGLLSNRHDGQHDCDEEACRCREAGRVKGEPLDPSRGHRTHPARQQQADCDHTSNRPFETLRS